MPFTFLDGSPIVKDKLHAVFERLNALGYTIRYRTEQDLPPLVELFVEVCDGERIVGRADFTNDGFFAHAQNVVVANTHRRQGIATAMYVFAEKVFGRHLSPLWDDDEHSAAAKALWEQPNRPFGNPRAL